MRALFAGSPGGDREHAAHRRAVQPEDRIQRPEVPELHAARRANPQNEYLREICDDGLAAGATARGRFEPELTRAAGARAWRAGEAGLRQLLPHRLGFHRLGQAAGHPGRPGPRFGGRFDGRVRHGDHGHRSAAVQAALRAVPESRARQPARYRRRFLPEPPRRGHRLRARRNTATARSRRSSPSARWARRAWCATWAACMGLSYGDADRIAKMIPNELDITLAADKNKDRPRSNPDASKKAGSQTERPATAQLWDYATMLEGLRAARACTRRAWSSATAISPNTSRSPATEGEGDVVSQYRDGPAHRPGHAEDGFPRPEDAHRHPGRAKS